MNLKIEELKSNPKVKENLLKYNDPIQMSFDEVLGNGLIVKDRTFMLMRDLGIPIGAISTVDKDGEPVFEDDYPERDADYYLFTPLIDFDSIEKYADKFRYVDFAVNPKYMTFEQTRNIAYLIELMDDFEIFDFETKNSLQFELIDNVPLNYLKAMAVFNKYYTKEICQDFTNKNDFKLEDFYNVSGLKKYHKFDEIKFLGKTMSDTNNYKEKNAIADDIQKVVEELKQEALEKFKNESDIKTFLDNIGKFNNYSFNNQLLINLQKPNAEYVASFREYHDLGYRLLDGAKGIKIFIPNFLTMVKINKPNGEIDVKPYYSLTNEQQKLYKDKEDKTIEFHSKKLVGFKIGHVFDIEDTTMPKSVLEELNPNLNNHKAEEFINPLIKAIYKSGYKVSFTDVPNGAKGYCDHENKKIVVKKGLSNVMQLKVLIHEYAHGLAHEHLLNNNEEYQKNRNKYETEAESIAYTVSRYLGAPTTDYSLDYLYAWSKKKDFKEIEDSLSTIVNYSKKIIQNFIKFYDKELELEKKEIKI